MQAETACSRVEGGTEEAEGTQGGAPADGVSGVPWTRFPRMARMTRPIPQGHVQGQHVGVTGRNQALPERSIVGESASRGEHVKTLLGQEAKEPGEWL